MNYYEELGLSPHASLEEISQAYRQVARLLHPDNHPDEQLKRLAENHLPARTTVRVTPESKERLPVLWGAFNVLGAGLTFLELVSDQVGGGVTGHTDPVPLLPGEVGGQLYPGNPSHFSAPAAERTGGETFVYLESPEQRIATEAQPIVETRTGLETRTGDEDVCSPRPQRHDHRTDRHDELHAKDPRLRVGVAGSALRREGNGEAGRIPHQRGLRGRKGGAAMKRVLAVAIAWVGMTLPAGGLAQNEKLSQQSQGRAGGQAAIRVHRLAANERSPDGRIHVRSIRFEPEPGKSARGASCTIEMENTSKRTVTIHYTVRYLSHTGAALQYAVEDYIPFTFGPGEVLRINHASPFHTARKVVVEILEPGPGK